MNQSYSFPIFFFFFFFFIFVLACADEDQDFSGCNDHYNCGELVNIGYPFWGNGRPEKCGHKHFELKCFDDRTYMSFYPSEYQVVYIDPFYHTIDISRPRERCPPTFGNETFAYPFAYSSPVRNLTLFYNCTINPFAAAPSISNFSCPAGGTERDVFYMEGAGVDDTACNKQVEVLVEEEIRSELFKGVRKLDEALYEPFSVNYLTYIACDPCLKSGGRCGTNLSFSSQFQFTCFCHDGHQSLRCDDIDDKGNRGWITKRKVIIVVVTIAVVIGLLGLFYYVSWWRNKESHEDLERARAQKIGLPFFQGSNQAPLIEGGMQSTDQDDNSLETHYFNLTTIREATNNFSNANKLGEGGFGPVYKGELMNGEKIAVKRLSLKSRQGIEEFKNEVMLIVRLQHRNLVRLLGYCLAGDEKLLVYEYMANTSLDTFLFDPIKRKELDWAKRANFINGTAKGLQYLHEDSRLKIIHRDMKASNVLLDDELNPKISDFGTARIFRGNQFEANTERVVGTYGYMAPEYALEGLFSVKSDVYSFGVLMLEIITGKNCRGFYELDDALTLLSYASKLWTEGEGLKLIDPDIVNTCPKSEALRWIHIALLCVQNDPAYRPTMSSVSHMLGGNLLALPKPLPPPWHAGRVITMSDQSPMSGAGTGSLSSDLSFTGR